MRKLLISFLAFWLSVPFVLSAQAGSHSWSSLEGDFNAGLWLEEFLDRQQGVKGNRITAEGEGYSFHAVLASTEPADGCFKTTYTDGKLTLGSDGPWLHDGSKLVATGLTATNVNCSNGVQGCPDALCFTITLSGHFEDLPCLQLDLEASYSGNPEGGLGNTYMAGKLNSAEIAIVGPDPDKMAHLQGEIADIFAQCGDGSHHGKFLQCVAKKATQMKNELQITGAQKLAIQSCATHALYSHFESN
jgi:hypothetical protein